MVRVQGFCSIHLVYFSNIILVLTGHNPDQFSSSRIREMLFHGKGTLYYLEETSVTVSLFGFLAFSQLNLFTLELFNLLLCVSCQPPNNFF